MPRSGLDREQLIEGVRDELEARQEIVLALMHGSFPLGGAYRDIDVAADI
jgi:hypothetical protein